MPKNSKKYYKRLIDSILLDWKNDVYKKPLLLRGARQVGKSSAVRHLGEQFDNYVEINFEENKAIARLFNQNLTVQQIVENLSVIYNTQIIEGKTLLFFDEIQSCIPAISSLRFFYEQLPDLHIIAAGSLLEFALAELPSFGVGRVRSMFLYPFSFDEFLAASGENLLLEIKQKATVNAPLQEVVHQKLLNLLQKFLILGGMPEVVAHYLNNGNLLDAQQILDDLYLSFKADFTKYNKKVPTTRLTDVFEAVVKQTGGKFVPSKALPTANHSQIKGALDLLIMAGLVIPITHTAANGLPLGAETDPRRRKMMLLDTGIFQRVLGLDLSEILLDTHFINKGAIAEMFFGLEILKYASPFKQNDLYYWHREAATSSAEIDYVLQRGKDILPIEIKSSQRGSMQSLFLFLRAKNTPIGYRFSLENFSTYQNIHALPLYAVSNL